MSNFFQPADQTINIALRCQCADCQKVQQFLRDPKMKAASILNINGLQAVHIHDEIQDQNIEVSTETEGWQKMILRKTHATYHEASRKRDKELRTLLHLEDLLPKTKKQKYGHPNLSFRSVESMHTIQSHTE